MSLPAFDALVAQAHRRAQDVLRGRSDADGRHFGMLLDNAMSLLTKMFGPLDLSDAALSKARARVLTPLLALQTVASDYDAGHLREEGLLGRLTHHEEELLDAVQEIKVFYLDPDYIYLRA